MSFSDLHRGGRALLLPNAWDVASAMTFVDAGYEAVGTTSLGVAASQGVHDASRVGRERTRELAQALRALPCYLSVDIEDGFDDDPERVATYVADLDVDGINLEDSTCGALVSVSTQCAKIDAVRKRNITTFINARVDTFWLGKSADLASTLDRARAYSDAGADGVFVPGKLQGDQIATLAAELNVPLNVLPQPGLTLDELSAMGVRRVSSGSLPFRAALAASLASLELVREGSVPPAVSYTEVQKMSDTYAGW